MRRILFNIVWAWDNRKTYYHYTKKSGVNGRKRGFWRALKIAFSDGQYK